MVSIAIIAWQHASNFYLNQLNVTKESGRLRRKMLQLIVHTRNPKPAERNPFLSTIENC